MKKGTTRIPCGVEEKKKTVSKVPLEILATAIQKKTRLFAWEKKGIQGR